ncbi:MAG TPA: glycosyltransferase family A protein, partial [Tepidisphaeraceae bacterium]
MSKPITAFLPFNDREFTKNTIEQLNATGLVDSIHLLAMAGSDTRIEGGSMSSVDSLLSSSTIQLIASRANSPFTLFLVQDTSLDFSPHALNRFLQIAQSTGAGLVYADYHEVKKGVRSPHPTTDYQLGSLKDDFTFGSILFLNSDVLKRAAAELKDKQYKSAGLYSLRLAISRLAPILRIPEFLYAKIETDIRTSGEKQFDYVDPRNRAAQIEMEQACTDHLKKIGAYLEPTFKQIDLTEGSFDVEASVVIPVKNRARTISDAVTSVLQQKTDFPFNLIVVDNHSTDGTTDTLRDIASKDDRVVHVIPQRHDLGIGGCWTEAVHHADCGRFAVQLDSDDIYKDETTLQRIVDTFRKEKCAMVIGSYTMTNFQLQELP